MRPLHVLLGLVVGFVVLDAALLLHSLEKRAAMERLTGRYDLVTAGLGLTDLCIATEARYTRHPAVSDPVAPFMDHPGALEHFPTGSFWVTVAHER